MNETINNPEDEFPRGVPSGRAIRAVLNAAGGAIPLVGGVISWSAGTCRQQRVAELLLFCTIE